MQVTGVMMAMMMTGRVLLVCALCVLWCGVAAVLVAEGDATNDQISRHEFFISNWYELLKNECDEKYKNETVVNLKTLAVNCCLNGSMRELCSYVYGNNSMENKDPEIDGICKEYGGKRDDDVQCPKDHIESLPDTKTSVELSDSEALIKEKELRTPSEEVTTPPAGASPGDSPAKAKGPPPPPPVEGQPDSAADLPVPHSEEASMHMKPSKVSGDEDNVTTADTKQDETSNVQTESTKPTPPVDNENDDNETEKGTGQDIHSNTSEYGVTGKGEKREGNKDNNLKQTPVDATGIKNIMTNGDSDGSTAVSHTTSPLLLLLLVACAAATAVVAA
ncbi:mucin-associated surface protein (MASP), putative [Trypanosoma cruzi marinkellei]|uniref:Mucin-associated surface protein (MASP), putative n=1 Tax=Trypanosoma cruzi marinkellei TaxID=85056 RepID=K2MQS8_TRYCR|nr:mucin-associated surface protein (MASP), putative [Trypanosoma cruzi marinkellei]